MPGHKNKRLGLASPSGGPPGGVRHGSGIPAGGEGKGDKSGIPAQGMWPAHTSESLQGNEYGLVHGASSQKYYGPVAHLIAEDLLTDAGCPDYLKRTVMVHSIRGWAEAEAKCVLARTYLESLDMEDQFTARKQGQAAPIEIWSKLEKHAANMRSRLGLDPVSASRIGKSLTSAGLDLAKMAAEFGDDLMGRDDD